MNDVIEQLMRADGVIPIDHETTAILAREVSKCRAALAMRNSDVQELVRVLTKVVAFYDKIEEPHHPGEAKLLDGLETVIKSIPHP